MPWRKIVPMDELRTWVINLDRAPDRLQRISAQLDRLGLPWTRLPAVDARSLQPEERAALDEAAYRRRHGMTPLPGELGCYLSHVAVVRAFLASEARYALVLEDDVKLGESLPAVLRALAGCPERWDMVKLSAVHSGTPVAVRELTPGHRLTVMLSKCTGASAYLINRHAAQSYADGLLPMTLPYDHVFDQGWRFGLKVRLVSPPPCGHDDVTPSTMGYQDAPRRKFHWTKRGSAYAYRLGNEGRRLAYGLGSLLREKLS